MKPKQLFDGVYSINNKLATLNLNKGDRIYEEELIELEGEQYRSWTPYRSKLSAAIANGLKTMEIKRGSSVLYLGASTGTTSSHVSDIVGNKGCVYCVEISERSMRDLINLCQKRQNMLPILADASDVSKYSEVVPEQKCDVIYQDISAREQAEIMVRNAIFLKKNGYAYFVIKSQSIDVGQAPKETFKKELAKLEDTFEILEKIDLEPYDSAHMFAVLRKKK